MGVKLEKRRPGIASNDALRRRPGIVLLSPCSRALNFEIFQIFTFFAGLTSNYSKFSLRVGVLWRIALRKRALLRCVRV